MASSYVNGEGRSVELGKELGKGGEGSVFELVGNPKLVAKIYNQHHYPDIAKQDKLKFMVNAADEEIRKYAAWPVTTLRKKNENVIIGFLMPRVSGRADIHMIYSPAHRKQDFPKAAWDFLIWISRNAAAAFSAVHQRGHVLGDVNHGNLLVGVDSTVTLIDTDSFQINTGAKIHLCKVGVAHFTPPELQGSTAFDKTIRTVNHDNFGLALLIFHLLFGGRHPYSGVPLTKEAGEALESDIKAFRFAYATDAKRRGFDAPPRSIPLSVVPEKMQRMFHAAFTEVGVGGGRPTSQQWMAALDELRTNLKSCATSSMHVFSKHLANCPWCRLEQDGLILFVGTDSVRMINGNTNFVLERVWAAILAETPPAPFVILAPSSVSVMPNALPPNAKRDNSYIFKRLAVVAAGIGTAAVAEPQASIFIIGIGLWIFYTIEGGDNSELLAEKRRREGEKARAQKEYDELVARINSQSSQAVFVKKKSELGKLRDEYLKLPEFERGELDKLKSTAENRQKQKFLERFFIDQAEILGVGLAKKAALRSFGIETAADVSWHSVHRVRGFGDALTGVMVSWRKQIEQRFRFNPQNAVTEADKSAIRNQVTRRKLELESHLVGGLEELRRIKANSVGQTKVLGNLINNANQKLAQAIADLQVIK